MQNLSQFTNKNRRARLVNEINVTPMVDVMLVLLIIFMITSPMLMSQVEVDLPKTKAAPFSGQFKPLVITINQQGNIFIADTQVSRQKLVEKLSAVLNHKKDTRIFIRGDNSLAYGKIVEIMTEINQAGFTKVSLVSELL